jgi:hypothetical protein
MIELYCPKDGCATVLIPIGDDKYFCAGCNTEWIIWKINEYSKDLKVGLVGIK